MKRLIIWAAVISPAVLMCGCALVRYVLGDPAVQQTTQDTVAKVPEQIVTGNWTGLITGAVAIVTAIGGSIVGYKKWKAKKAEKPVVEV